MEITKQTTVYELLKKLPNAVAIFEKYNFSCPSCTGFREETIGKVCVMHGADLDIFLAELNELASGAK